MPPNAPPPKKLTEKELKDKAEQKWGKRNIGKVEKIRRRKIKTRVRKIKETRRRKISS
ncbi:unnamed protein product [Paramecium octaurelia]|uniref:Uncharacterized protein n=1 Tax=Paramecium octaurelia TaxID=43137 RepID=A0A8S1VLT7_PAROT|nr:unnamed protein product [Paramecium octaurelia]